MVYGYFCFRLSLAGSRPAVGNAGRDVICVNCRCYHDAMELPAADRLHGLLSVTGTELPAGGGEADCACASVAVVIMSSTPAPNSTRGLFTACS